MEPVALHPLTVDDESTLIQSRKAAAVLAQINAQNRDVHVVLLNQKYRTISAARVEGQFIPLGHFGQIFDPWSTPGAVLSLEAMLATNLLDGEQRPHAGCIMAGDIAIEDIGPRFHRQCQAARCTRFQFGHFAQVTGGVLIHLLHRFVV